MATREQLIRVFLTAEKMMNEEPILQEAIRKSLAENKIYFAQEAIKKSLAENKIYFAQDTIEPTEVTPKKTRVVVTGLKSFSAAKKYAGKHIAVLNFASFKNPGGFVRGGSPAQEECLCRCSTLLPNLEDKQEEFYNMHIEGIAQHKYNSLYNDDCIYTPNVIVFQSDDDIASPLPQKDWFTVDVITCAAPNVRYWTDNDFKNRSKYLSSLFEQRFSRIMEIAKANGVEVLILGAFGCGVFKNPPELVAQAAKKVIKNKYFNVFETIEFAVYCTPGHYENWQGFKKVFSMH